MKRAQGMTEYIIIVGLIAILLISAVKLFGGSVRDAFGAAKNELDTQVVGGVGPDGQPLQPGGTDPAGALNGTYPMGN